MRSSCDMYTDVIGGMPILGLIVSFALTCHGRPLSSPSAARAPRLLFKDIKESYCSLSCLRNAPGPQTTTLASDLQTQTFRPIYRSSKQIFSARFAMSYPTTHRAVTVVEKGKVSIQEKQLPVLGEENILVRVRSVALNPADWKAC